MAHYAQAHLKEIAARQVRAHADFVTTLMSCGGIAKQDAEKVLSLYKKMKLIKEDVCMGVIRVKHGALLDRDVINRALADA